MCIFSLVYDYDLQGHDTFGEHLNVVIFTSTSVSDVVILYIELVC